MNPDDTNTTNTTDTDTETPAARTPRRLRLACVDFVVISALLAWANYLFAPDDPGWLALNPSPLLLLPLLIAVRYGFFAGTLAGLGAAGLSLAALASHQPGTELAELVRANRYLLTASPLAGAVLGLLTESIHRRLDAARSRLQRLEDENSSLNAQRNLLLLAREDLQQRLGLFGAPAASLDDELRELAAAPASDKHDRFLDVLHRIGKIRAAGLYQLSGAGSENALSLVATFGDPAALPARLNPRSDSLVISSLTRRAFVAQEGLYEKTPQRRPGFLAAAPILSRSNPDRGFLLAVQDMPFNEINERNLAFIQVIAEWYGALVVNSAHSPSSAETFPAVSQEAFYEALQTASSTHLSQAVPSTVVRIALDPGREIDDHRAFQSFLARLPENSILTTVFRDGYRQLLFLFPAAAGAPIAEGFQGAFLSLAAEMNLSSSSQPQFFNTAAGEPPQQLWGRLFAGA